MTPPCTHSTGIMQGLRRRTAVLAACLLSCACAAGNDRIDDIVLEEMAARHIPGLTFAIVQDGRVADVRAYGLANLEWNGRASADTVYAIGSVTKSMTAIIAMMLAENGDLELDALASTYIEVMPQAWSAATVRHLLTNTSGIPEFIENPCGHIGPADYTQEDALAEAACLPLQFEPGDRFEYSNTNYLLLSMMLARVSEQKLDDLFAERLFNPLGMTNTRMADYEMVIPWRADGYLWTGDAHVNVAEMDPVVETGAGGVISTAGDMALFILALGGDELLSQANWRELWTPPAVPTGETRYALGFGTTPHEGRARVGHNGAAPGFASAMGWFPEERTGIILLTNGYEEPHGRSAMGFANRIVSEYFPAD